MVFCCVFLVSGFRCRFTLCVFILSFISVWVAEWLPFGKELLTRLTICSLSNLMFTNPAFAPILFYFVQTIKGNEPKLIRGPDNLPHFHT